jgi:hypothetical protein
MGKRCALGKRLRIRNIFDFDDIGDVLPIVAYWCRLNTRFADESYVCRLIEGSPVNQIFETDGSAN